MRAEGAASGNEGGGTTVSPLTILDQIRLLGRTLDDVEHARIVTTNRLSALVRPYGGNVAVEDIAPVEVLTVRDQLLCRGGGGDLRPGGDLASAPARSLREGDPRCGREARRPTPRRDR